MEIRITLVSHIPFLLFLFLSLSTVSLSVTSENPFTARASVIRYWNNHVSNSKQPLKPPPDFLLSKASPLSAVETAFFARLASQKALSSHLSAFCSAANLFCLFDDAPMTTTSDKPNADADFALYNNKKFSNYGTSRVAGADVFKNYSDGINFATGSFTRYSRSSTGHGEGFTTYADDGNVANANFTSYGSAATGGAGEFSNYHPRVNVPNLRFASYDSDSNGHKLSFSSYTQDTNSGSEGFASYGKNGNGVPVEFGSYGNDANLAIKFV